MGAQCVCTPGCLVPRVPPDAPVPNGSQRTVNGPANRQRTHPSVDRKRGAGAKSSSCHRDWHWQAGALSCQRPQLKSPSKRAPAFGKGRPPSLTRTCHAPRRPLGLPRCPRRPGPGCSCGRGAWPLALCCVSRSCAGGSPWAWGAGPLWLGCLRAGGCASASSDRHGRCRVSGAYGIL